MKEGNTFTMLLDMWKHSLRRKSTNKNTKFILQQSIKYIHSRDTMLIVMLEYVLLSGKYNIFPYNINPIELNKSIARAIVYISIYKYTHIQYVQPTKTVMYVPMCTCSKVSTGT